MPLPSQTLADLAVNNALFNLPPDGRVTPDFVRRLGEGIEKAIRRNNEILKDDFQRMIDDAFLRYGK